MISFKEAIDIADSIASNLESLSKKTALDENPSLIFSSDERMVLSLLSLALGKSFFSDSDYEDVSFL